MIFVGMGSNLGDRKENIQRAIGLIGKLENTWIMRISPLYESEPMGEKDQPWFINGVVEIETSFSPRQLLTRLKEIEKELGRKESFRWGPRIIDLDILFYNDLVIKEKDLEIPHPRIPERRFVLLPLMDIAPGLKHPLLNLTPEEMLANLQDELEVRKL